MGGWKDVTDGSTKLERSRSGCIGCGVGGNNPQRKHIPGIIHCKIPFRDVPTGVAQERNVKASIQHDDIVLFH